MNNSQHTEWTSGLIQEKQSESTQSVDIQTKQCTQAGRVHQRGSRCQPELIKSCKLEKKCLWGRQHVSSALFCYSEGNKEKVRGAPRAGSASVGVTALHLLTGLLRLRNPLRVCVCVCVCAHFGVLLSPSVIGHQLLHCTRSCWGKMRGGFSPLKQLFYMKGQFCFQSLWKS